MSIVWHNFKDTSTSVAGMAIVTKGFKAYLHSHSEREIYHFLSGKGYLYIDGNISIVHAPYSIEIDSNKIHAMTPISDFVILKYEFPNNGPFNSIKYHYLTSHI